MATQVLDGDSLWERPTQPLTSPPAGRCGYPRRQSLIRSPVKEVVVQSVTSQICAVRRCGMSSFSERMLAAKAKKRASVQNFTRNNPDGPGESHAAGPAAAKKLRLAPPPPLPSRGGAGGAASSSAVGVEQAAGSCDGGGGQGRHA